MQPSRRERFYDALKRQFTRFWNRVLVLRGFFSTANEILHYDVCAKVFIQLKWQERDFNLDRLSESEKIMQVPTTVYILAVQL